MNDAVCCCGIDNLTRKCSWKGYRTIALVKGMLEGKTGVIGSYGIEILCKQSDGSVEVFITDPEGKSLFGRGLCPERCKVVFKDSTLFVKSYETGKEYHFVYSSLMRGGVILSHPDFYVTRLENGVTRCFLVRNDGRIVMTSSVLFIILENKHCRIITKNSTYRVNL